MSKHESLPFDDLEPEGDVTYTNGRVSPNYHDRRAERTSGYGPELEMDDLETDALDLPHDGSETALLGDYGATVADLDEFDEFAHDANGSLGAEYESFAAFAELDDYDEFGDYAFGDGKGFVSDQLDDDVVDRSWRESAPSAWQDDDELYDELYAELLDDAEFDDWFVDAQAVPRRRKRPRRHPRPKAMSRHGRPRSGAMRKSQRPRSATNRARVKPSQDADSKPQSPMRKDAVATHKQPPQVMPMSAANRQLANWLAYKASVARDPAAVGRLIAPIPALAMVSHPDMPPAARAALPLLIHKVAQQAHVLHRRNATRSYLTQLPSLVEQAVNQLVQLVEQGRAISPSRVSAIWRGVARTMQVTPHQRKRRVPDLVRDAPVSTKRPRPVRRTRHDVANRAADLDSDWWDDEDDF